VGKIAYARCPRGCTERAILPTLREILKHLPARRRSDQEGSTPQVFYELNRDVARGVAALEADAQCRKQPLQNCRQANQDHQNFQKIGEPPFANKSVDDPEANRANDADDQNVYQD